MSMPSKDLTSRSLRAAVSQPTEVNRGPWEPVSSCSPLYGVFKHPALSACKNTEKKGGVGELAFGYPLVIPAVGRQSCWSVSHVGSNLPGIRFLPETGVTDGCEPPCGNHSWMLCKSSSATEPPSPLSSAYSLPWVISLCSPGSSGTCYVD